MRSNNLLRVVFEFNNCFPIFFTDVDFCAGSDAESLSNLLREDDPTFRIHLRHIPTYGGNKYGCFGWRIILHLY